MVLYTGPYALLLCDESTVGTMESCGDNAGVVFACGRTVVRGTVVTVSAPFWTLFGPLWTPLDPSGLGP
jgi:hypothetical protein